MAYEYPTNFSNGTSVDSLGSLLNYANYVTGDFFATGFILIISVMAFFLGLMGGVSRALMTSGFISGVFLYYFARLGMVNPVFIIVSILMVIFGVIGERSKPGGSM